MASLMDIKVDSLDLGHVFASHVYANDEEIKYVTKVEYTASVGEIPQVVLTIAASGLEAPAQAMLSYTPETLQEATKIIAGEYLTNTYFRAAVISSINSVLNERWMGGNSRDNLASRIADRVFGLE